MAQRIARNIYEKFSPAEFSLVKGLRDAHGLEVPGCELGAGFAPYQLSTGASPQGGGCGRSRVHWPGVHAGHPAMFTVDARSTLYAYSAKVLERALQETHARYPGWLEYEWVEDDRICRSINFTSSRRAQAAAYCMEQIHRALDDRSMHVTESVRIRPADSRGRPVGTERDWKKGASQDETGRFRLDLVVHQDSCDEEAMAPVAHAFSRPEGYIADEQEYRFSADQVFRHIVHVEDRLMALLHGEESIPPLRDVDALLFQAIEEEDFEACEVALANGADVNVIDALGTSPLGMAVLEVQDPYVALCWMEILLAQGADPDLVGFEGYDPLYCAVHQGAPAVELLLNHGADPNINTDPGGGPLLVSEALDHAILDSIASGAAECGEFEKIIKLLVDAGAVSSWQDDPKP